MLSRLKMSAALIAFSASFAHAAAVNISNNSFEDGWGGWNDTDPSSISGESYNGSQSAKISGVGGRFDRDVSLQTNTDYRLTAYVKGSGTVGINLGSSTKSKSVDSSSWTKVTVDFNSGTASSGELFGKYNDGQGRFDDYTLESIGGDNNSTGSEAPVPGTIQAEDYASFYDTTSGNAGKEYRTDNVDVQSTTDSGGGYNVGWTAGNEWLEFPINVTQSGTYRAEVRVASSPGNGMFTLEVNGSTRGDAFTVDNTGGWQSWETLSTVIGELDSGSQTLRVQIQSGGFNINWIKLSRVEGEDTLNSNRPPSENFDLTDWYLTVPLDEDDDDISDNIYDELSSGYTKEDYFYTADDGGMVFKCYIDGYKTSKNTDFTRTELREQLARGTVNSNAAPENNWVFSTASSSDKSEAGGIDGKLRATLAVNHVTKTGIKTQWGRVVIGQIHAKKDEPLRLYYRKLPHNDKGSIYIAHEINGGDDTYYEMIGGRASNAKDPEDGIALGEKFSYEIEVKGNDLTVSIIRDGKPTVTEEVDMKNSGYTKSGEYMYFKAGVYNQNNTGDDDDYVQATFYELKNTHTGWED